MAIMDRLKSAWNAFRSNESYTPRYYEYSSSYRPDRSYYHRNSLRSMLSAAFNQIAVDCAAISIKHVRLDKKEDRFKKIIPDSLNYVLTKQANIDQTAREFIQDVVESMLDEGVVALVPFKTDVNPAYTDSYKIYEVRVGKILEWMPTKLRVDVYDERDGKHKELVVDKRYTPVIQNPFYTIMNEQNSTGVRLSRLLNQLEKDNSRVSSNKLDMIIQLPYSVKNPAKKAMADERKKDIEDQLANSPLGLAYIDSTERVIQLNRSLENNLWEQAKELQKELFNQIGFSEAILNGTADEQANLNYFNHTIEPIMAAIVDQMEIKWLSRKAIATRQAIRFYRDPFKLTPVIDLAKIADTFTRNEIMTSNEFRAVIGMQPSSDPKADELRNSNLNHPDESGKTIEIDENIDEEKQNE